jgi:hypothetical protein
MAPEILSVEPYDHSVDYWSLGILIYALLSGEYPLNAAKDHIQMNERVNRHVFELNQSRGEFSDESCDLVRKLLRKNPHRRLKTLNEIKKDGFFQKEIQNFIQIDLIDKKQQHQQNVMSERERENLELVVHDNFWNPYFIVENYSPLELLFEELSNARINGQQNVKINKINNRQAKTGPKNMEKSIKPALAQSTTTPLPPPPPLPVTCEPIIMPRNHQKQNQKQQEEFGRRSKNSLGSSTVSSSSSTNSSRNNNQETCSSSSSSPSSSSTSSSSSTNTTTHATRSVRNANSTSDEDVEVCGSSNSNSGSSHDTNDELGVIGDVSDESEENNEDVEDVTDESSEQNFHHTNHNVIVEPKKRQMIERTEILNYDQEYNKSRNSYFFSKENELIKNSKNINNNSTFNSKRFSNETDL